MIFHKLLIIYRNSIRNKGTTFINIAGLSTGIASTILIYLWVADEMNVDKFHDKNSQLYQVFSNHQYTSGIITEKATTGMLEQTLSREMPEIENVACFVNYSDNILLSAGDKNIKAGGQLQGTLLNRSGMNDKIRVSVWYRELTISGSEL